MCLFGSENELQQVQNKIAEKKAAVASIQQEIKEATIELKQVNLCYNMMVGILVCNIFVCWAGNWRRQARC